jgi:hypothetical protein
MAMQTVGTTAEQLRHQATVASPREMAGLLREVLTPELTAYVIGLDDVRPINRWASGESTDLGGDAVEQRVRVAYEIVSLLLMIDAPRTIQAWFTGQDPNLDGASPAERIREGRFDETLSAATAFVAHG